MNTAVRPSYLLTFCAFWANLYSLAVLTSWIWLQWLGPGWQLVWCDANSPVSHWVALYLWSLTGCIVAYYLMRGCLSLCYRWTIASYVFFWTTAFAVVGFPENQKDSLVFFHFFLVLMVWSDIRYEKRARRGLYSNSKIWGLSS